MTTPKARSRVRYGRVARPRLQRVFDSVPGGGVGMLVAPAGAGKSVLMGQWVGDHDSCWLALTDMHNDGFALATAICEGLHDEHEAFDAGIAELAPNGGSRLGAEYVRALCSELADLAIPVLMVIDDLHEVTDVDVLADVGQLLLHLPGNVRVLVSSRWDLPLGLGRMRLRGDLIELRAADLAFGSDEATAMLELTAGRPISERQARALVDRTEGWAAGLQLAAISLAGEEDPDAFIARFAGDDRLVVDYLAGAVLQQLDERTRSFLLQVSVLKWMTPELCVAVTQDADARSILLMMADHGFFLTREGASLERFRLHQLIADVLRYQLAAEDPAAEAQCRRRAAEWLLSHHEYESGIDQLLAAGEPREAYEVLAVKGHHMFERGRIATVVRALTRVHGTMVPAGPEVQIHLLAAQLVADEYATAAENYRELSMRTDLTPGQRVAADTLGSLLGFAHLPLDEVRRLTDGVLRSVHEVDPASVPNFLGLGGTDSCEAIATGLSALTLFLEGDLAGSAHRLEHVMELPGIKYQPWRIIGLGMLAFVRCWEGRLTEAEGMALAALDTARDVGAMDHPSVVWAQMALSMLNADRLDVGVAEIHLGAVSVGVSRCRRPLYDQFHHILKVRHLAIAQGAEPALAYLRDNAPHGRLRPLIELALTSLHAQLLARTGLCRGRCVSSNRGARPAPPRESMCSLPAATQPEPERFWGHGILPQPICAPPSSAIFAGPWSRSRADNRELQGHWWRMRPSVLRRSGCSNRSSQRPRSCICCGPRPQCVVCGGWGHCWTAPRPPRRGGMARSNWSRS